MGGSCDKMPPEDGPVSSKQQAREQAREEARATKRKQRQEARDTRRRHRRGSDELEDDQMGELKDALVGQTQRLQEQAEQQAGAQPAKPAEPAPAPEKPPARAPKPAPVAEPQAKPTGRKPEYMVVRSPYLAVKQIKSGEVLQFEHSRVNSGLRGGAPKGAVSAALFTRRREVEAAILEIQEQVQSGTLTREGYIEGAQKLHKVLQLLLKQRKLEGDDAVIAQSWLPVVERELTAADAEFTADPASVAPASVQPAPMTPEEPHSAAPGEDHESATSAQPQQPKEPAPEKPPASAPKPAPVAEPQAKPAGRKPEYMVVRSPYLAVKQIKSGEVLQFEHSRVNSGLRGGAPKGAVSAALFTRRREVEAAILEIQEQVQSGTLTREGYIEGAQKLHKVLQLLLKQRKLEGDDAVIAQSWLPVVEHELTAAGVTF